MDTVEQFVSDFIVKSLHRTTPNLTPADDAKIRKVIADLVTTAVDMTAAYFALRAARSRP